MLNRTGERFLRCNVDLAGLGSEFDMSSCSLTLFDGNLCRREVYVGYYDPRLAKASAQARPIPLPGLDQQMLA